MANYTTGSSDKKKDIAKKKCFTLGIFGAHMFYVGKIKAGIVYFVIGFFCAIFFVTGIAGIVTAKGTEGLVGILFLAIWYVIVALKDGIRILLGTFKDNVGAPLRG